MFLYAAVTILHPPKEYYKGLVDREFFVDQKGSKVDVSAEVAEQLFQTVTLGKNNKVIIKPIDIIFSRLNSDPNSDLSSFLKEDLEEVQKFKHEKDFYKKLSLAEKSWFDTRLQVAIDLKTIFPGLDGDSNFNLASFSKETLDEVKKLKDNQSFYKVTGFNTSAFNSRLDTAIKNKMNEIFDKLKDLSLNLHQFSEATLDEIKKDRVAKVHKHFSTDADKTKFDKKLQKAIFARMTQAEKETVGNDNDERTLIHNLGFVFESKGDFKDVILPFVTKKRYDAVLERVEKDLGETDPKIDEDDRRFLAFWEMRENFSRVIDVNKRGSFILESKPDGDCFWHSLLGQRPELLLKLGFDKDGVMKYIKASRFSPEAQQAILNAKKSFVIQLESLKLKASTYNTALNEEVYDIKTLHLHQATQYEEKDKAQIREIFKTFAHSVSDSFLYSNDENVIEFVKEHIGCPGKLTEAYATGMILAFILKIRIFLEFTGSLRYFVSYDDVAPPSNLIYTKIWLPSADHAQRLYELPKELK